MERYREVERKFDAAPGEPLPDLSDATNAVSQAVESKLEATYFDTVDGRLASHRITLRRRTGGDDAGWHLKLPVARDERTEIRLPLGDVPLTVPAALVRQVRDITGSRPLVVIAVLSTTRVERRLLDGDGSTLAIVADDVVRGRRLTDDAADVSWREVEVELVDGDTAFLDSVSDRLRAAGLTRSGSASKLARVLEA